MKTLLYSIHHQVRKALLAMAIALPMVSCHTVWDDDDDCPVETEYRVKFVHDYNMLFTDAFATQVRSITLYAFDEDGKLVWTCPQCGNRDQSKMNVARRTCGYIGTQYWNQGRTQEIRDRVLHL